MLANVTVKISLVILFLFVSSFVSIEHENLDPKTKSLICFELVKVVPLTYATCVARPLNIEGAKITNDYQTSQSLLCKDNDMLAFQLNSEVTNKFTFVTEIANSNDSSWSFALNGTFHHSKRFSVKNLSEATLYDVRTWLVTEDGKVLQPLTSKDCRTSFKDGLLPIEKIETKRFIPNHEGVDAVVEFMPAKENISCYYFYVYYKRSRITEGRIEDINSLFQVTMPQLDFSQNYTIGIRATSKDYLVESKMKEFTVEIPSCLYVHRNLSVCPPDAPTNLAVEEIYLNRADNFSVFNLNVSWAKPDFQPSHYQVSFDGLNGSKMELNITGNATSALLTNVKINHIYQVFIVAWSQNRRSKVTIFSGEIKHKHTGSSFYMIVVFVVLSVTVVVCTAIGAKIFWMRYKHKRAMALQQSQYFKHLTMSAKNPSYMSSAACRFEMQEDEWEILTNDLTMEAVIGQGAFGIVRHGWLKKPDQEIEVAVKMLKNAPTFDEMKQFHQELEIMKTVGNHPHLVSLIGYSLKDMHGPLLVVEYCSRGDLQSYLKSVWNKIINNSSDYLNHGNAVSNIVYDIDRIKMESEVIQPKELLSFARQIAIGMEYLANLKILHRDLAARNVLVCDDKTVKISDFGLSRDVYVDNIYRKTAGGKLPIRWMALECLTHQQYTTQSDVWSFGILLWEIVNLGGCPYPGVQTEQVLKLLKSGYRMECPSNCGNEIYDIMCSCWRTSPKERPTFTELRHSIEALMENETEYLHIDLNTCMDINNTHASNAKDLTIPKLVDRYVRPRWNVHK